MIRWKLEPDTITAMAAVVVSAAALFVAADQARIAREQASIMREEVNASVWPAIQLNPYQSYDERTATISLSVRNVGVGPVRMKGLRVRQDERTIDDLNQLFAMTPRSLLVLNPDTRRSSIRGRILAAGETVEVVRADWSLDRSLSEEEIDATFRLFQTISSLNIEACYCSALDRCWIASNSDEESISPTESCDAFEPGDF